LRGAAQGPESDSIIQALQLQFVAGRKLQLFPHRLWQHYATQLVYRQFGKHCAIVCWNLAKSNTINRREAEASFRWISHALARKRSLHCVHDDTLLA